ncbi:hypothetical protein N657DRAFT_696130 [Parathielavia appendiculata]|uniref:Uncharacterized protein n=1 Tax=Parathielavia appendiculata TaxID=2587402 RepID=A0AAN6Z913_9PEZI|nr:hypothetical protein N657DRAFT_696130 [Parathielavia appendiculata]
MNFPWGRLAAFIVAALALSPRRAFTSRTDCTSETGSGLTLDADTRYHKAWTVPISGAKPLFGLNKRILDVGRRDCVANGSNYCFGNNVDFCAGCGNCCIEGNYCCGKGKICSEAKCLNPLQRAPVTATSTIFQTVNLVATQRATVVIVVIEKSTVVSAVDATISTAATQTSIVWVTATATALAERAPTGLGLPDQTTSDHVTSTVPPQNCNDAALRPRQAKQGPPPTVTSYVTETTELTSISTTFITVHTTSTEVTTVYLTNTRVLRADTTTTITSTLTLTSHRSSTSTLTTTAPASPIIPPSTASSQPDASTSLNPISTPPQRLPTQTIAGIAAGSSVLALFLAGFVILAVRRRHHSSPKQDEDGEVFSTGTSIFHDNTPGGGGGDSMAMRQPTLPVLPHFAVLPPAHHAVEYRLPVTAAGAAAGGSYGRQQQKHGAGGEYLVVIPPPHRGYRHYVARGRGGGDTAHGASGGGHQRNGSGYTTLVGTPSPTVAGFGLHPARGDGASRAAGLCGGVSLARAGRS